MDGTATRDQITDDQGVRTVRWFEPVDDHTASGRRRTPRAVNIHLADAAGNVTVLKVRPKGQR